MSATVIMLGLFIAVLAVALIVAFATGRAYHGQPFQYAERSESPVAYWMTVIFMIAVLAMSAWALIENLDAIR